MKCSTVFIIATTLAFKLSLAASNGNVKPNIIMMQPDDMKHFHDWGSAPPNNPTEPSKTVDEPANGLPNMEFLRTNGLQMMQAYTVSPMCGTSRYSTM